MTMMCRYCALISCCALACSGSSVQAPATSDPEPAQARCNAIRNEVDTTIPVISVRELLAQRDSLYGKRVHVHGYSELLFEGTPMITPTRIGSLREQEMPNGQSILLGFTNDVFDQLKDGHCNKRRVVVEGILEEVNVPDGGHLIGIQPFFLRVTAIWEPSS